MLPETETAVGILNDRHVELVKALIKRYEDGKEQFAADAKELPDWIQEIITANMASDPSFVLTDYPAFVLAAKDAVGFAKCFDSRSAWARFQASPSKTLYQFSKDHSPTSLQLSLALTNMIIEKTYPEILTGKEELPLKHNLRLLT